MSTTTSQAGPAIEDALKDGLKNAAQDKIETALDARPNILLITCDQYRYPRFSYGPGHGFADGLKRILALLPDAAQDNDYAKFFPGLLRLGQNAIVLRNHTIAASACTPSRATIYTGQYGTRTGVTQTDGLFKNGDTPNFPWLDAGGIPTMGTWLREAGYQTHYFGKWHISNPPEHSLDRYGFDNWEESYPEPHGAAINNLGLYRDLGFSDAVCGFLRRQSLALNYNRVVASASARNPDAPAPDPAQIKPWFAVASFVNPHDIATYPAVIAQALPPVPPALPPGVTLPAGIPPRQTQSIFRPMKVPLQGDVSELPAAGTIRIPLNPLGFPQDCANPSPTQNESLDGKPSCQFDYSYKMGLALAAKTGHAIAEGVPNPPSGLGVEMTLLSSIPFHLAADPHKACLDFIQLYGYLHAVVDTHIDRTLQALEETGLADNTIVIFLTDHGEMAAAHGMMMEKWHNAYQETLHVPVAVKLPPGYSDVATPRSIEALTSHIDILPTVLGLAGIPAAGREAIARDLADRRPVPPLPGVDLKPLLLGETDIVTEPDGRPRQGVLFITDDEITAPLPPSRNAHARQSLEQFAVFDAAVGAVREGGTHRKPVPELAPGPVRQPNHVRCVRTEDYKLARYFDPSGKVAQEWEMYDLRHDPHETANLVQVTVSPPTMTAAIPPWVEDPAALQQTANDLAVLLAALETRNL